MNIEKYTPIFHMDRMCFFMERSGDILKCMYRQVVYEHDKATSYFEKLKNNNSFKINIQYIEIDTGKEPIKLGFDTDIPKQIRPDAVIKSVEKSIELFGEAERKKNYLNAVCSIRRMGSDESVVVLIPANNHQIMMHKSDLDIKGWFVDIKDEIINFQVGDIISTKKKMLSTDGVVYEIVSINSSPEDPLYGTASVLQKFPDTGVNVPKVINLKKYKKIRW